MKKKVSGLINKNLKKIVLAVIIIAIGLGGLLMLISGNADDRDEVPADPDGQQTEQKQERKKAEKDDHPGVSDEALALYNARVDQLSDTAAIAQLTETIDIKKNMGDYMVTLQLTEESKEMLIAFDVEVYTNEQTAFDENMNMYAQQLLALIADADNVKWTYTLKKENKTETIKGSLNCKKASEVLKLDVKDYGESPEMVQTLLNTQKGIT